MERLSILPNLRIQDSTWLPGRYNPRIFRPVGIRPQMIFEKQLKVENLPITTELGQLAGNRLRQQYLL